MEAARPLVKRTYSRLVKTDQNTQSDTGGGRSDTENATENGAVCLVSEAGKRTKITDFFRKRLVSDEMVAECGSERPRLADGQGRSTKPLSAPLKQTYLDLGQRDFVSTQCPDCLMHYNKSFPEDTALHRRFHAQHLRGFTFTPGREQAVSEVAPPASRVTEWRRFRFFSIAAMTESICRRLSVFLNFMHIQLGAAQLESTEMRDTHSALLATDANTERIVAFVLFEPIERAFASRRGADPGAIEVETEVRAAAWGVSRIWVDGTVRRRGLASLLLDLKTTGNRAEMAFSQPTPAGFAFAKAYQRGHLHGEQCLIYLGRRG